MRQIKSKSTGGAREGAGRPPGRANVATTHMKATLSELAREHTAEALEVVLNVMREGETDAIKLAAAVHVLDRGYGKPAAAVSVTDDREAEMQYFAREVQLAVLAHLAAKHDVEGD